jgi:hypothetical protein
MTQLCHPVTSIRSGTKFVSALMDRLTASDSRKFFFYPPDP